MDYQLHYNFVFYRAGEDYWQAILGRELYESDVVKIRKSGIESDSRLLQRLFFLHWSNKVNRIIPLPGKSLWFKKMATHCFDNNLPVCHVFMGTKYAVEKLSFIDYIKYRSPKDKVVLLFNDLISKKHIINFDEIKSKFDLITTYDKGEAELYGIHYFPETVYSALIDVDERKEFDRDVLFLGAAKDRYETIIDIFQYLTKNNLRCDFYIFGAPANKRYKVDGIHYIDKYMPYIDTLKQLVRSKCVLEVIQGGSIDITTRMLEALAYKRRILTNSPIVSSASYYNDKQICCFSGISDIDIDFITRPMDYSEMECKLDMSPFRRIIDIDQCLVKGITC